MDSCTSDGDPPRSRRPAGKGPLRDNMAILLRRHWLVSALLAAGLALRVATQIAYQPALISGAAIQHLLGLAEAVALYAVLLRRGAYRWLAALAVAPVLLDAYQLQMEQMIMPDVWFEAMLVAGLVVLLASGLLAPGPGWRRALSAPAAMAGRWNGSRSRQLTLACLLFTATAAVVLLAPDVLGFSWRYQLPAVVTLPPAGVLGICAVATRYRSRRQSQGERVIVSSDVAWSPGPGDGPQVTAVSLAAEPSPAAPQAHRSGQAPAAP